MVSGPATESFVVTSLSLTYVVYEKVAEVATELYTFMFTRNIFNFNLFRSLLFYFNWVFIFQMK